MDIKFKELKIENFMSIGDAQIDLTDRGFTLIEGVNNNINDNAKSNGSGKSSIFESLVWCLTGNTIRGNKSVVNYNGNDGALVKLSFNMNGDEFVITRTKDHSKYKTNLFIEVNGVDKSGKGIRDTESILSEYLPDLTSSLIGSVIVLGQGLPQKFSANSPSGRKEVLEKLFKSDYMIQDLKDRISRRRAELNDDIRDTQDRKLVNLTKIDTITDRINLNKARLSQLDSMSDLGAEAVVFERQIDEMEAKLQTIQDECGYHELRKTACQEELYDIRSRKLQMVADIDSEYAQTLSDLQSKLNEATVAVKYSKVELDRAKSVTDVCPTCGQKLPEVHKPNIEEYETNYLNAQKSYNEINNEIIRVKAEIEQKKSSIVIGIDEELTKKESEYKAVCAKLQELTTEQSTLMKTLSDVRTLLNDNLNTQKNRLFEMESLTKDIKDNENVVSTLTNENSSLEEKEKELEERLAIESKFNTAITRDFRGYLLNDIIVYINNRAKEYCKDVFNTDLIDFYLDGNNLMISYNNKEYEALSGGERQKVDLIIQFAIRDMLCKHTSFSSNIIVLDEIFDNLDNLGCQKIIDLITNKLYDISSIFVITHHGGELSVPYDNVIKIEKDDNGITRLCV